MLGLTAVGGAPSPERLSRPKTAQKCPPGFAVNNPCSTGFRQLYCIGTSDFLQFFGDCIESFILTDFHPFGVDTHPFFRVGPFQGSLDAMRIMNFL